MEVSVTARAMDMRKPDGRRVEMVAERVEGSSCDDDFDARAWHPRGVSPRPGDLKKTTPACDRSTTVTAMLLTRLPFRPAVASSRTCLRCFSSGPQKQGTPPKPPHHLRASC
jgi:hypothetical protein